jgi:hypothetical protein
MDWTTSGSGVQFPAGARSAFIFVKVSRSLMERIWLSMGRDAAIIEEFKNSMSLFPLHPYFTD